MRPVREQLVQIRPSGRNVRLVISFADLRMQLTPDGEVSVLGFVHHMLRRLVAEGAIRARDAHYRFDDQLLELSVPRSCAERVVQLLTTMLSSAELAQSRPA